MKKYILSEKSIPEYIVRLSQSGACSKIIPVSLYEEGCKISVLYDEYDKLNLTNCLNKEDESCLGLYEKLVDLLFGIISSVNEIAGYLVPEEYISLLPEDIYFDGSLHFLLKPDTTNCRLLIAERTMLLCLECEEINRACRGKYIAEKLMKERCYPDLSRQQLLNFFTKLKYSYSKGFDFNKTIL